MTTADKQARQMRHDTRRAIFEHIQATHLGLRMTNGQLKAAARTLYAIKSKRYIVFGQFHWTHNNQHTPRPTC